MKRILAILALTLILTGCSSDGSEDKPRPTVEQTYNEADVPEAIKATWGETVDYGDGIKVTVSKPQSYELEEGLAWSEDVATLDHVLIRYTITNQSGKTFDTSTLAVEGEDTGESEPVTGTITDGSKATGTALLHVEDAASATVTIDLGDGHPLLTVQ